MTIEQQYRSTRLKNKINQCEGRFQPQFCNDAEVEYGVFQPKDVTWDDNKNDELKQRK